MRDVNISANKIGFRGCIAIEEAMQQRDERFTDMSVDLEGNLVLQEVSKQLFDTILYSAICSISCIRTT